jgi:hypothetical protein
MSSVPLHPQNNHRSANALSDRVIDMMRLQPLGPGRWRGLCEMCRTTDAFTAEVTPAGFIASCTVCGVSQAGALVWRLTCMEAGVDHQPAGRA